tara:strand:- start:7502 stop:8026 length:525 start_codon:yes stop_codon:yes gene_type:complete
LWNWSYYSFKYTFDDLAKLDIRVGTILKVSEVEKSDKLMKLSVDFGDHKRTILAGIKQEREDYSNYLLNLTDTYKVLISKEKVVAAFGISQVKNSNRSRVTWIMVCPNEKGKGIGTKLMSYVKQYTLDIESVGIDIAASYLSSLFFKKFGAIETNYIKDGWGNDMHRIDMEINF